MQNLQAHHIPKALSVIQTVEFLAEYFGKSTEKRLYQYFLALEFLKLLVKLRKWHLVDKLGVFISDNNHFGEVDQQEEEEGKKFQEQFASLDFEPPISDAKQIKEEIKQAKQPQCKFNIGYFDVVGDKQLNLLTTLPIPQELRQKDYNSKINKIRIFIGELIHLVRPLIYCSLILYYGGNSYKPYFISFIIDVLRLLLELRLKLFRRSQSEELRIRVKDAIICYILRNPFYSQIIKQKILSKILSTMFSPEGWISRLIYGLIELRSSKCLLL